MVCRVAEAVVGRILQQGVQVQDHLCAHRDRLARSRPRQLAPLLLGAS